MEDRSESVIRYKVNQLIDTGMSVALSLTEDVELEKVSQQQLILDSIDNLVTDKDVKQQVKPFLEAILRAQPQTVVNTYSQTTIQITMPKRRYQKIGHPQVGDTLTIDIKKE
jgi:phage gp29-like protein